MTPTSNASLFPELETPTPIVDLDRMAANLDRMSAYATAHGLALRPHTKTHKSPVVAREQLTRGAAGLTCATPREMEVMSPTGADLLMAYPPVGEKRLRRVIDVAQRGPVTVALDSLDAVRALTAAARENNTRVGVYVELDLGMHRVGVPAVESAIAIARAVAESPPLQFAGLAFYPGHLRRAADDDGIAKLSASLDQAVDAFERAGLPVPIVSGGSTPLAWRSHEIPATTEIRPGTYVYNDRATIEAGACRPDECALTVLATVVSTAVEGQAVIDAGTKALGREPLAAGVEGGFGALLDMPEVRVIRMSEEHGVLDLSTTSWRPRVGDRVRVVPNHVCIVVHLNDQVYGVRGGDVETSWTVAARGR